MTNNSLPRRARTDALGPNTNVYDNDFYSWTQQQAALLRSGRAAQADLTNIAEEIETLGRSEASALRSSYRLIALHLLKMKIQPEKHSRSWHVTVVRERGNIDELLADNPGLKPKRQENFERAYVAARREASAETMLPLDAFPATAPFTLGQVEDHDFWPKIN